ncbi:FHA domain-containing protein [Metallosphaera hakonensis]|uniref:FHA domain-containing protein n=1 Tax=Metallosphaera hakonensis JCM 8857 = DSM 7519 TaxID=1293036 RepID=A0A2U9IXS5_9CREN|nr:FHA domain-containing protein [Metallosphaera hakonensis]AWS00706.1 FHA domain-containing protein [Metallosphaera hakonensis JCM 8857 = DSM 7519]
MTWKCSGCGTENPDDAMYCTTCGLKRPDEQQALTTSTSQEVQVQETEHQSQASEQNNQPVQPENQPTVTEQTPQTENPPLQEPVQQTQTPETTTAQENQPITTPITTQQPPSAVEQGKYYVQFIATPVSALNKTKVPLDFEVFESISIGRSPENVLMIPDGEISRRHALLYKEGDSLFIEDLNSTNGTYIYDGKVFQAVKGKAQLPKNAVVKLGNGTIIKIVRE